MTKANAATTRAEENDNQWVSLELPLPGGGDSFSLEAAVCSHGLFAMAPNQWDPLSKTLLRPLRLWDSLGPPGQPSSESVTALISQPQHLRDGDGGDDRRCVRVRVHAGTRPLSLGDEEALLTQVKRMLRLSETDDKICRDFSDVYDQNFMVGRVFRSPSLFEDMVKCILLCNCSWPRTLAMAQSLCDLQLELQMQSVSAEASDFIPKTPSGKEPKRMVEKSKAFECSPPKSESSADHQNSSHSSPLPDRIENDSCKELGRADYDSTRHFEGVGNFPTPLELSRLDENFLAKRCKLGYRAKRILNLARGVVEGRIQLREMEETCRERSLRSYSQLDEQLKQIYGFGPFTRANVLMCMGFYHVVPSDSETIRHLKQVHGKNSSIRTIEKDVQQLYAKYEPFQFLAYWSELWHFYETKFGKFSEMACSEYKLVTASNMRSTTSHQNKRKRTT